LYYYRARFYDPMIGRFLSEDPIGFSSGDVNLYRYVANNPINLIDPLGLEGTIGNAPQEPTPSCTLRKPGNALEMLTPEMRQKLSTLPRKSKFIVVTQAAVLVDRG
jgi:uncharacterized protein RhaS with RHS repeats